jgi:hypothetical protein
MHLASEACETVASSYQIGVMTIGWDYCITPILEQTDDFPLHFERPNHSRKSAPVH